MDWMDYVRLHVDGIVIAVSLLILAFIVSAIVKGLVTRLLTKTRLQEIEDKAHVSDKAEPKGIRKEGVIAYLGKLVYLLVFLLFIPGIFSSLGVSAISQPISSLLNTVWGYMPNIIAATVVLVAGTLIAKLVRELLIPLFKKLRFDKLQDKAGLEVGDNARLSVTLAYIVYVLIIIPVIIVALQALKISVISEPAVGMLNKVLDFIPNIAVALVLIIVGSLIAKFSGQIVRQLIATSGADAKIKVLVGNKAPKFIFSDAVGIVVRVVLNIFFIVEGVDVLELEQLTNIGATIIGYLPNAFAAVLLIIAAFLLATATDNVMAKAGLKNYSIVVRSAIIVVTTFMVLNQLGIAGTIVNWAFIIILSAIAVAFAISFGIGSRGFATRIMDRLADDILNKNDNKKEE